MGLEDILQEGSIVRFRSVVREGETERERRLLAKTVRSSTVILCFFLSTSLSLFKALCVSLCVSVCLSSTLPLYAQLLSLLFTLSFLRAKENPVSGRSVPLPFLVLLLVLLLLPPPAFSRVSAAAQTLSFPLRVHASAAH